VLKWKKPVFFGMWALDDEIGIVFDDER